VAGAVLLLLIWFFWKPYLPSKVVEAIGSLNKLLPIPTRLLYGGVTEELLLRWGLMTLLVYLGWRVFQKGQGKPHSLYFIFAIAISAILFGVGHLPVAFLIAPDVTAALVLYVIVANSVFGMIAGYLYWKIGLESAVLAHMIIHVVLVAAVYLGVL
jgi:hypothetical protein